MSAVGVIIMLLSTVGYSLIYPLLKKGGEKNLYIFLIGNLYWGSLSYVSGYEFVD